MTQRIYTVPTLDALAVYEPEIRAGIDLILADARTQGNNNRTADDVWEEIEEHVKTAPHARVWLTIEAGVLVSWVTGKCYVDGKKRTGCITWAWAAPQCQVSREIVQTAEAFFRERECQRAALGRSFLQPAFTRLMRRYGYTLATVVYEKSLAESEVQYVDSLRPVGGEVGTDHAERNGEPVPAEGADPGTAPDVRYAGPGVSGTDGEAAGDGNQHADPASGVDDAGDGSRDAAGGGATGESPGCPGTGSSGWFWRDMDPGSESTGAPDPGTAGPPAAE